MATDREVAKDFKGVSVQIDGVGLLAKPNVVLISENTPPVNV